MKKYFKCGEFASLCKVTKRVLFYYDEIHLLKPAYIDENGYRYYSFQQYDKLSTIKMFQSLGMSLKEIQQLMIMENIDEKKEILNQQLSLITQKIEEYQLMEESLQFLNTRFENLQKQGLNQLFVESCEKEYFQIEEREPKGTILGFLNSGYQYGVIFEHDELLKESHRFSYVFQKINQENANYIKPSGDYYTMYFDLNNDNIFSCISEFLSQIDVNQTQGPLFHENYCSEIIGIDDQFIIKCSIKKR